MPRRALPSFALLAFFALSSTASRALAQDSKPGPRVASTPASTDDDEETESYLVQRKQRVWYGWQPLIADGAFLTGLVVPATGQREPPPGWGYLLAADYFLASPIIHAAHDRWGVALGALGMRALLPVIGAFAGYAAAGGNNSSNDAGATGAFTGFAIGLLGAMAIDDIVLARTEVPIAPRDGLTIRPSVATQRGGASFGLSGSF
jgi:hypothetical protein